MMIIINKNIAGSDKKQCRQDNVDKIKQYYQNNAGKIEEHYKHYYQDNVDKIKQYYQNNADKLKKRGDNIIRKRRQSKTKAFYRKLNGTAFITDDELI